MNPLVFKPFLRPQIWGGRRLERLGKQLPADGQFGESWEISSHSLHVSRVAEGELQGASLAELDPVALYGDAAARAFPLLVKFLDCRIPLSVQVHPNDEIARELLTNELGKTEAWVIIDADPAAKIYAGLKSGVTRSHVEQALQSGNIVDCLHSFTPRAGDCILLPAGHVHAIGGGVLLAEIQQTSDATFRLFDWNRLGADHKPRTLHHEQSLRSIDWTAGPVSPVKPLTLGGLPWGVKSERLAVSPHFEIERISLQGEWSIDTGGEFSIWILLQGQAMLTQLDGSYARRFSSGETVLIPAASGQLSWRPSPSALLLGIRGAPRRLRIASARDHRLSAFTAAQAGGMHRAA